jgi:hypothetical protein
MVFPSTEERAMNTTQKISFEILRRVQAGMELREAFDAVLGAGAYDKLAGDVHDALSAGK